jgi:scyllo-inositol 2-dehydrogenase (NADP+)
MKNVLLVLALMTLPLGAQEYKIAVVGLVHSHVWGHLHTMVEGKVAKLVGVSEPNPELVAEAKKAGVPDSLFFPDYRKMLDGAKPDIVWAFVENNRHLEVAKECASRHINLIFEKPLAANYAQAKEIKALAEKNNIRVMTNYQMAWWPANYVAKAAVDKGEIGKVWRLHGIVGHGGPGSEGPRNKYFFEWLTDPEKNGAGALMDFGCYNALWSLWYLGRPTAVYALVDHLRPERFPKVEDNADLVLSYPNGVGLFEGSWDLPRSYQDLELFGWGGSGDSGSIYMEHDKVELRKGKKSTELDLTPLPEEASEPIAYMVSRMKANQPIEGLTAIDINVDVIHIIDLAKESVRTGKAVKFQ